ncbi:hypothetical protein MAMT_00979 [Methylacidimicrobium tartarophylax]|uniref:Uncharacterized protein n=1 Tax=Methylacidimicrobium tartarophylax TaxID=1041768 RepID=A0A5E6MA75_9BACT|nr:hypothetical protein MAMT_00979 [Methylacidimicrobium tartarophylax]
MEEEIADGSEASPSQREPGRRSSCSAGRRGSKTRFLSQALSDTAHSALPPIPLAGNGQSALRFGRLSESAGLSASAREGGFLPGEGSRRKRTGCANRTKQPGSDSFRLLASIGHPDLGSSHQGIVNHESRSFHIEKFRTLSWSGPAVEKAGGPGKASGAAARAFLRREGAGLFPGTFWTAATAAVADGSSRGGSGAGTTKGG